MIPNGYLKVNHRLSIEEGERIRNAWDRHMAAVARGEHKVIVLDNGIEFVPFAGQAVPNAICRYCWSPNLHTSTHCEKCGAPLLEVA